MTQREILIYPEHEEALRSSSDPVRSVDRMVKELIQDLKDTLAEHPEGIGLAAPQINVHSRVIIVRLEAQGQSPENRQAPLALVNPVILEASEERRDFDGCLSFPGLYGETVRPHCLRVEGLDETGQSFDRFFEGFDAVLVHHEIDHLNGVLFIDRIERQADLFRMAEDEFGQPVRIPVTADLTPGTRRAAIIRPLL